jgi:hypothetical protein
MFFAYYAVIYLYLYLYLFIFTYLTLISVLILYFVLIILTVVSLGLAFWYMELTYLFFVLDYSYILWMNSCTWIFSNAIKVEVEGIFQSIELIQNIISTV